MELSSQLPVRKNIKDIKMTNPIFLNYYYATSLMKETRDLGSVKRLMDVRRKIETVIGQLSEQFKIEKVRAKDLWHLMHRMIRKLLSHTMGVLINKLLGRDSLHFDGLIQT